MSSAAVAKRYAQALFELGTETSSLPALVAEIARVADAWASSPDLQSVMSNPLVRVPARLATMAEVATRLGVGPTTRNAVGVLARGKRLAALPAIARELARLADERAGVVRATVTSAAPLSEAYCVRLQRELERMTGKKIVLTRKQDPSLVAGVVAQVGDRIVDGSARARLAALREQLLSS